MSLPQIMPLIAASLALAGATAIGMSIGSTALLMTLAASASYIAVPAASLPAAATTSRPARWARWIASSSISEYS